MALGRDRTPHSLQGFDPDFFVGGGCSDGHLSSLLDVGLQDPQSILSFKAAAADHWACPSAPSVLSFEQGDRPSGTATYSPNPRQEEGCGGRGEDHFRLLYPSVSGVAGCLQEGGQTERGQKRPYLDGDMQAAKKLCSNNRKAKAMPSSAAAKDPQSIAAKNRRERISERLKVLQELVPNGTKVDLVTMLEKAISYVKFLQLQVKVLATDEFWPAQGGKAPEAAQVKEAIDAILSSHRGNN